MGQSLWQGKGPLDFDMGRGGREEPPWAKGDRAAPRAVLFMDVVDLGSPWVELPGHGCAVDWRGWWAEHEGQTCVHSSREAFFTTCPRLGLGQRGGHPSHTHTHTHTHRTVLFVVSMENDSLSNGLPGRGCACRNKAAVPRCLQANAPLPMLVVPCIFCFYFFMKSWGGRIDDEAHTKGCGSVPPGYPRQAHNSHPRPSHTTRPFCCPVTQHAHAKSVSFPLKIFMKPASLALGCPHMHMQKPLGPSNVE